MAQWKSAQLEIKRSLVQTSTRHVIHTAKYWFNHRGQSCPVFTVCHKSNKFIVYISILLEMVYY